MVAWSKFQGELAQQCQNVASIYMYLLLHKVNFVVMWMTVNFGALKRIHDWNRVVLLRYIIDHSFRLLGVRCHVFFGPWKALVVGESYRVLQKRGEVR